jgi:hypothetical protein
MKVVTFEDTSLLQFESLNDASPLVHAVTAKPWNMAAHRGPDTDRAVDRRRSICDHLGVSFDNLTSPEQIHGPELVPVSPDILGAGRYHRDDAVKFVDGLITDHADWPLLLMSADCPTVLLYDPDRPAIGAAHASWRGTLAGMTTNLVRAMTRAYGSKPDHLRAALCPAAGPCCYEIGPDLARVIKTRYDKADAYLPPVNDKIHLDLPALNRDQLLAEGLRPEHIELPAICTICDRRFYSHRADGPATGRIALIVALKA